MVHDGVQKGVLWREEALHHRHLGLNGWNSARSYWISILPTEKLEERASSTVRLTAPQCSDAGSYSFCQSPPPLPPKNYQLFIPMKYKSTVSVRKEPLSAFSPSASAARVRCHLALACLAPSSPSIQVRAPSLFLCAFISPLSLSIASFLALSEHTSFLTLFLLFRFSLFTQIPAKDTEQIRKKRKESHHLLAAGDPFWWQLCDKRMLWQKERVIFLLREVRGHNKNSFWSHWRHVCAPSFTHF